MTFFRDIWNNYRAEFFFFILLSACVAFGHWVSHFIPVDLFENVIQLIQHSITATIGLGGAWLLFSHSDGLRIRRASGYPLAAWGFAELFFILQTYFLDQPVLNTGSEALTAYMLFAGNFLGWLLLIYPTETLRPGWLNAKKALLQLLPLVVLSVLDYLLPLDLRLLISMYPVLLFVLVLTHIRAYRLWCENNYSSMEHIDVQWVVRYLIMLFVIASSYGYMIVSDNPCRAFTQNLLIQFMCAYSVGEILFRKDPWDNMTSNDVAEFTEEIGKSDNIRLLEQWMEDEKPYLNPDFKLMDLRAVLPMNRTYLSGLINTTYGCSFYQFVNRYRVEEAKRLMQECPKLKMADVAERSGFSSPAVFSQIFSKQTGMSPSEWSTNSV